MALTKVALIGVGNLGTALLPSTILRKIIIRKFATRLIQMKVKLAHRLVMLLFIALINWKKYLIKKKYK